MVKDSNKNNVIQYIIYMLILKQIYSYLEKANYSIVQIISLKYIR